MVNVRDIVVNFNRTGYGDEEKLKLIEFDTFVRDCFFETKGLVGVIQINDVKVGADEGEEKRSCIFDVKITITSRFDKIKPYFLSYMLSYENPGFIDEFKVESGNERLFTILLIYIYKKQMIEADKQGMFKAYQRFERNDDKLRGSIDIARHIKSNIFRNGKIAYNCRENTFDNTLNHLILHAYEHLKRLFPMETNRYIDNDSQVRGIINRIRENTHSWFRSNLRTILSKSLRPVSHPYYQKYSALQKTCIRILKNLGVSVFDGKGEQVNGVLFYIPDLWENFLTHNYKKHFTQKDFYVHTQFAFNIFSRSGSRDYSKRLRPDFVFTREKNKKKPAFILDAKFKPKWYGVAAGEKSLNEVFDDYLQVINYMVSCNAKAAGVIFPSNGGELEICEFDISKFNEENKFYCCSLFVPEAEGSYVSWVRSFNGNIERAFEKLQLVIRGCLDEEDR